MNEITKSNEKYAAWLSEIAKQYRQSQIKAATMVNTEMLRFYWILGKDISALKTNMKYGDGFFKKLSHDLKTLLPEVKSFSPVNLRYIEKFYLLYNEHIETFPQVGGTFQRDIIYPKHDGELPIFPQVEEILFQVPWGHHKYIIDKFSNNFQKALFFVQKIVENGWSRNMLLNFIDTDLYERQGKSINNFKTTLPAVQSDLAQEITKDPYKFDFLTLTEGYKERELKDALENNIRKFLLELGTGFAYVGREYRIMIGNTEKFIDMLFYNLTLRCYVVIEIKTGNFESENIGQLGTYVAAVNHILKKEIDSPTIGLLICKTKDNVLAKYALESSSQPIGVSEYELSKLYPVNFKGSLPSIEDIEKELNNNKISK